MCTLNKKIRQGLLDSKNGQVRKIVHHSDLCPDILSSWRQLLSLPISCHVHWPLSYCRSRTFTAAIYGEGMETGGGPHHGRAQTCGMYDSTVASAGADAADLLPSLDDFLLPGCTED